MFYKVTKKYTRGPAIDVALFVDAADAKLFIAVKLREDARVKVNVVYQLLEGGEVVEEFSQDESSQSGSSQGSPQRSSSQSFNPTPFNSAPRPPGVPHNWVSDDDKSKK